MAEITKPQSSSTTYIEITPPGRLEWPSLRDLYNYRELFYTLTWRDIRVLYKQTIIGAPWAVLQPLIMMAIYTFVFDTLLQVPTTGDVPFPLSIFVALLGWNFFGNGVARAASSIIGNGGLIRKVYFPRILLPFSSIISGLADLIPAFVLAVIFALIYGYPPTLNYLLLPIVLMLLVATTFGWALWLSALNAQYRDVNMAIPLLLQILFWLTPILYPADLLGETWRTFISIFPMTGVVEMFRWAIIGDIAMPPLHLLLISSISAVVFIVGGILYFQRAEKTFVDLV
ncbi:MAG: ABC transporter permease [Chloroflexi bacterium]|nr:ABC transporter permease [Chloroflexota bacterium]